MPFSSLVCVLLGSRVAVKSFLVASILVSTTLEALSLFIFHPILGLNHVPAGPFSLLFSIIYQYSRIVPSTYAFRIFGVPMDNNIFLYFLSLQVNVHNPLLSSSKQEKVADFLVFWN